MKHIKVILSLAAAALLLGACSQSANVAKTTNTAANVNKTANTAAAPADRSAR